MNMDETCTALKGTAISYKYVPKLFKYDIDNFLYREGRKAVIRTLRREMKQKFHLKFQN